MEEARSLPWNVLPAPVLSLVRSSCEELIASPSSHVTIDPEALSAYVASLDASALKRQAPKYPLVFPTPRSEINFLTTLAYLQIGSGWRRALHASRGGRGKGASETITFGVIGMHISGEITSSVMSNLGLFEVAQLFNLEIQEDYEISPGIHSERKTELYSLAEALRKLLNDAGNMLRNLACNDWAEFFEKAPGGARVQEIDEATGQPVRPRAEDAVKRLVRHFAGLQDAYVLPPAAAAAKSEAASAATAASDSTAAAATPAAASSSSPAASSASDSSSASDKPRVVYLLKKAQLIVAELYLRFGQDDSSSPFAYSDISSLTAFSDNVLPAVLRAKGVLRYTPELAAHVDDHKRVTNREQEACIRAGAVVAIERIVAEYNATHQGQRQIDAVDVDYLIWATQGKEPEMRKVTRHATHSIYY